jgi:bifunctional DNase/RNase
MLVEVKIDRVTLDTASNRFVVILRDDVNRRWLPIVVGSTEAQAIALQLENITPPRPLTHDLIKNLLDSIEVRVSRIVVSDLRENTYFAMIGLKINSSSAEIDARPSDALAIALRSDCPIFVDEEVMRKASVAEKDTGMVDTPDEFAPMDRLDRLNMDLQKAVTDERYEDAARIRDEINELKENQEKED